MSHSKILNYEIGEPNLKFSRAILNVATRDSLCHMLFNTWAVPSSMSTACPEELERKSHWWKNSYNFILYFPLPQAKYLDIIEVPRDEEAKDIP